MISEEKEVCKECNWEALMPAGTLAYGDGERGLYVYELCRDCGHARKILYHFISGKK